MSIEDIKDIKKLRMVLKEVLQENKRLKEYCQLTGEELVKNLDYDWDEKPKNLVLYASALNEKYENARKERNRYKKKIRKMKNEVQTMNLEENYQVRTSEDVCIKPERAYTDSYAWRTDYTKDFISDINRYTHEYDK